jgi:hypothetical protein
MAFPNQRTYAFDANMRCRTTPRPTPRAATAGGGADGVVDLGGNQGVTVTLPAIDDVSTYTPQQARIDAMLVLDVTAIDIASGNETYQIDIMVSNDPNFAAAAWSARRHPARQGRLAPRRRRPEGFSVTGRYEVPFTNNIAGAIYQFAQGVPHRRRHHAVDQHPVLRRRPSGATRRTRCRSIRSAGRSKSRKPASAAHPSSAAKASRAPVTCRRRRTHTSRTPANDPIPRKAQADVVL